MHRRPDLLAVPRPLALELYPLDARDPRYLRALVEYAQANRDHVEGLYTSPAAPEVQEHIYTVWMDLLERYDLDGLHFDYVRYPAPDYDYSRVALDRFRVWIDEEFRVVEAAAVLGGERSSDAAAVARGDGGEIRATALEYGLLSQFTAFVAVDSSRVTEGAEGTTVPVPVPVPAGVKYETTVPEKK